MLTYQQLPVPPGKSVLGSFGKKWTPSEDLRSDPTPGRVIDLCNVQIYATPLDPSTTKVPVLFQSQGKILKGLFRSAQC